jgi:plasmid stabilization system protein ParE
MRGHALHPEAYEDIDEIREYIAEDFPDAADRIVTEIFDAIRALVQFPARVTDDRISRHDRFVSNSFANMSSPMLPTKSRCGWWRYSTVDAIPE